ncbi:hypothetical protein [Nonomuraea recticatena]|uniref:Uncharacterized protein n=1 Tax=Nonomuraea recticatena TaxID=46178 RepID=A0ABN3SAR5_9ACTN
MRRWVRAASNAIADGLADLMSQMAESQDAQGLRDDSREMRQAAGLEDKESA